MSARFPVFIYHNPVCGTSRHVLEIVRAAGYRPEIVLYLEMGWTRPQLLALLTAASLTPRAALRDTGSPALELGLLQPGVADETLLAAMLTHPILVNRPLVATPKGVRLCRPSEIVLDLLERQPPGPTGSQTGSVGRMPGGFGA